MTVLIHRAVVSLFPAAGQLQIAPTVAVHIPALPIGIDFQMLQRFRRKRLRNLCAAPQSLLTGVQIYQKLLALDEVDLRFEDDALEAIAARAMERDTGARALRSVIEEFMMDIMYEIPKDDNIGTVTITRAFVEGKGGPVIGIRSETPRQIGMDPAPAPAPAGT